MVLPGVGAEARSAKRIEKEGKENNQVDSVVDHNDLNSVTSELSEVRKSSSFTLFRQKCGQFVDDPRIENLMVFLIVVNSTMMGMATFDIIRENEELNRSFEICDQLFLILFTIELSLQIIYRGFYIFLDGWLTFDFIVIAVSWVFNSMKIIRAFRIFRALRLVTRIGAVREVVGALLSVMPKMFSVLVLLLIILYIFGVMFTTLFKNSYPDYTSVDYFSSLNLTFFTLFQILTLDNWAEICREVQSDPDFWWAWFPFMMFVVVSGFVVVNLIIAIVCDAISDIESDEDKSSEVAATDLPDVHDASDPNFSEHGEHHLENNKGTAQEQLDAMTCKVALLLESQKKSQLLLDYLIRQLVMPEENYEKRKSVKKQAKSSDRN